MDILTQYGLVYLNSFLMLSQELYIMFPVVIYFITGSEPTFFLLHSDQEHASHKIISAIINSLAKFAVHCHRILIYGGSNKGEKSRVSYRELNLT